MNRRFASLLARAVVTAAARRATAWTNAVPDRPRRMVIPFSVGGGNDIAGHAQILTDGHPDPHPHRATGSPPFFQGS